MADCPRRGNNFFDPEAFGLIALTVYRDHCEINFSDAL